MGSFSAWHWLTGAPMFVLLAVVGFGLYYALRRSPAKQPQETPQPHEDLPLALNQTIERTPFQKIVSIAYMVGGAIGLLMTLPQINGVSLSLMSALAWLFLLAQIAAAIYGGWQYWQGNRMGLQILYWLSWSCVPVISFPLLSYWCALGIAVFPTVSFGAGHFGTDLTVRFGYDSSLWLFPSTSGFVLGANLAAIWFAVMIDRTMKATGIPRWPLELVRVDNTVTDRAS